MINSTDFSKRIQKVMERNDLNASSFAEAIQVGRSSISHILSGRNKPSLDLVMNIVQRFPEVDLYWLLNGKGSYPKLEDIPVHKKVSEPTTVEQPVVEEKMPLQKQEPAPTPDLFSTHSTVNTITESSTHKGKNITKVIILYSDGSFKDYIPE
ncbi:helix-turn-helix domain-containing protein [Nonlabens sp.]|uniref:helix-turn-helix domain-containing protein n=1 Tax=Nonlabens sp. TaxID=1888209 RepID=UPI003F6983BE